MVSAEFENPTSFGSRPWISAAYWSLLSGATFLVALCTASLETAVLSCLLMICSRVLVIRSVDVFNPRRITIASFWYLSYLAMIFFPAFLVFADQEGPYRGQYLIAV